VRYFPRQPRTPVLPRRPPDSWSTSYPAGRTCWHLQTPVCHHCVTTKKIQCRGAVHATLLHLVFLSKGAAVSATLFRLPRQTFCVRGARGGSKKRFLLNSFYFIISIFISSHPPPPSPIIPPLSIEQTFQNQHSRWFQWRGMRI
jgi:hypothetical protein